jgi:multicomponent K+:H+ antiporter subunit G
VNTCQPLHGSVFALIGATGLLRMKDVFQHMQPPALASTLGTWCAAGTYGAVS